MPKNIYLKLKDDDDSDLITLMEKSTLTYPQFFKTLARVALVKNMDELKTSGIFPLNVDNVKPYSTVNSSNKHHNTVINSKDTGNNSNGTGNTSIKTPSSVNNLTQQILSKNN